MSQEPAILVPSLGLFDAALLAVAATTLALVCYLGWLAVSAGMSHHRLPVLAAAAIAGIVLSMPLAAVLGVADAVASAFLGDSILGASAWWLLLLAVLTTLCVAATRLPRSRGIRSLVILGIASAALFQSFRAPALATANALEQLPEVPAMMLSLSVWPAIWITMLALVILVERRSETGWGVGRPSNKGIEPTAQAPYHAKDA